MIPLPMFGFSLSLPVFVFFKYLLKLIFYSLVFNSEWEWHAHTFYSLLCFVFLLVCYVVFLWFIKQFIKKKSAVWIKLDWNRIELDQIVFDT